MASATLYQDALYVATHAAGVFWRPDLFVGREALASRIIMASLIWNDRTTAWLGPVALAAAVGACALLVIAAGAVLEHSDVT